VFDRALRVVVGGDQHRDDVGPGLTHARQRVEQERRVVRDLARAASGQERDRSAAGRRRRQRGTRGDRRDQRVPLEADRQSELTIERGLVREQRERLAQRGDRARAFGIIEPRRRRRVIDDRLGEPEPPQQPREAQVERAEVDQHEQVGWI
jgi:hypothetical protein